MIRAKRLKDGPSWYRRKSYRVANLISERITEWGHALRHGRVTQLIGKATDLALETDGVREVVSFLQVT